jgi:type VI secretion system protein ImpH
MASTRRRSHTSLKADLFDRPQSYELFQAVRLLEAIAASEHRDAHLDPVDPVGHGSDPADAALRIRSSVPLGFAAAEVTAVRRSRDGGPIEMTQTIVGLTGPSGVLPHALSELVQVSVRERNLALREFFDVFNNRLAGLLYTGWAKHRLTIERERARQVGTQKAIDQALKSIVGLGLPSIANRTKADDSTFVFFGGLLGRQGRSAMAIERTLSGTLGHELHVEQFHGEWLAISPADRTRLPGAGLPEGAFARLGDDMVIGERTFDIQSTVLICVRALGYADFRSLLPDGSRSQLLSDVAANALGADKVFRIRLELRPEEVPDLRLEREKHSPTASRLGWNTWLTSPNPRDSAASAEFLPLPHLR